jgi:Flp pilus assembly protein TadD
MNGKILLFDNSDIRYRSVAEKKAELGEYEKSLGLLFSIKDYDKKAEVVMDIADTYADMGLLELSNRYWYKYMDLTPKDKHSVAFEELAINYFYLEDFWASSYYFHKKIDTDGFLSKEGIDQEILDFFAGEEHKKAFYHVAYPFDRADYSGKAKLAKHAIASGKFGDAVKILTGIPKECMTEEYLGDLAVAYYMNDDLDNSAQTGRESLAIHGDNVTAFCNLSTIYDMKEDVEKSEYYYQKALECRTGERTEAYKIATCAIERDDHKTAKECLKIILNERPYDTTMRFFYGLAGINLGEYDFAEQELERVLRIDNTDSVVKYYLELVKGLKSNLPNQEKLLPLKYVKEVPEKVEKKRAKVIKDLSDHPEKIANAIKKKETRDLLIWGLKSKNSDTIRQTAYVLSTSFNSFSKKAMLNALLDNEALPELKRVLVYALTVSGYKEKYGVVAGSIYIKVSPKKIPFEKQDQTGLFVRAYALAMSRAVFWDLGKLDKLVNSANKLFKKLNGVITDADVTGDELASLMIYECKFEKLNQIQILAHLFDIKKERLSELIKKLLGDKNGKNN